MNNYIPSINESINAKNTSTSDLCETFIVNEYYHSLASASHTIMMGPRGSGKTTLMRMLEVRSLELWEKDNAQRFRESINFSGVFIPTDRVWKTQYENTRNKIKNPEDSNVLNSQFIYHVLEKLAQVVSFRTTRVIEKKNNFRHVNIEKNDEVNLVNVLSELWHVNPKVSSLKSLIISLTLKKNEVSKYLSQLILQQTASRPLVISSQLYEILDSSVSIINTFLNEDGEKWAFLFDELELAPDDIIQPLINSMRGGHPDIILKLALSPYHKGVNLTSSPGSSMKYQDLSFINLTELTESEGVKFSKALCQNLFFKKGIFHPVDACFENPADIDIDQVFNSLSSKDESFSNYLQSKKLLGLDYVDADVKKSPQLRKIKFIAYLRDYVKRSDGRGRPRRRAADFYAGFENICKSTEYNPRMLIGIMNMFIPIIKQRNKVSISEQISGLEKYYESFRSLLSTIAVDSTDSKINNIYDLVDLIAMFFKNEIYGPKFNAEPKGILVIDGNTPPDLRDAIGFALNAGAMISVESEKGDSINKDGVVACRLSYIFSHQYGLLLTKQTRIQLHTIMAAQNLNASSIVLVSAYSFDDQKQMRFDI